MPYSTYIFTNFHVTQPHPDLAAHAEIGALLVHHPDFLGSSFTADPPDPNTIERARFALQLTASQT